ncbi:MAG: RNA polymerase sigma factor [Acidimicrobiia bacterium]|nr:RNA polymerase sigma factor [Acidimicrobiia bacterium]
MTPKQPTEDLLRDLAPQVLGALIRRYGNFDLAEEALQEGMITATQQWAKKGIPENPRGWLIRVSSRRLIDSLRSESARKRREDKTAAMERQGPEMFTTPLETGPPREDDTLALFFMCCHPSLTSASQVAVTLRAVGGLTTAEIARAHLVPEATMAQRISRAKQTIRDSDVGLAMPSREELNERLRTVLHVLYLVFNEGYSTSTGSDHQRTDLSQEAVRLTRMVSGLMPDEPEVKGLLALMVLNHGRRHARTSPEGELIPLEEQDRSLWDRDLINEGLKLVEVAFEMGTVGSYQLQAAIAAIHAEAATAAETDWLQISGLYLTLERISDNPMVSLGRAVAVGKAHDPRGGLGILDQLEDDKRITGHHRMYAVRGHLLEMLGELGEAEHCYREAAARTTSLPEQRYLHRRASEVKEAGP